MIIWIWKLIDIFAKNRLEELIKRRGEGKFRQNFNYHTHTYRSGHSAFVSDKEMLMAAKKEGIKMLGFSEHIPFPELILPDESKRMLLTETDGYIKSINSLKKNYSDMKILVGFEAEYDFMKEEFLFKMRDKVDYMILGQHFVIDGLEKVNPATPEFPLIYADTVCKGIESGLFDIVAHPDFFMRYRNRLKTENEKEQFEKNAIIASKKICEKARDMGIPLEINLSQIESSKIQEDGNYSYPHPLFWKEASKLDELILIRGIDAHRPSEFIKAGFAEELILDIETMVKDKIIYYGYDPVLARINNPKLQKTYNINKEKIIPFETNIIECLMKKTKESIGLSSSKSSIAINKALDSSIEKCIINANKRKLEINEKIDRIMNLEELDLDVESLMLERMREAKYNVSMVLENQVKMIKKMKKIGLGINKNDIIIKRTPMDPDIEKIRVHKKKYGLGFVSTLLISILTIIAGIMIIAIIRYFYTVN